MTDLDIVVQVCDLGKGAVSLEALGFESTLRPAAISSRWLAFASHELGFVRPQDGLTIELHWRQGPAWFPTPVVPDDAFARMAERDFLGAAILWPAAEELLLMHVADAMKSCGCGMRWMSDLVAILRCHPELDWEHLRDIARRRAGLATLATAMAALRAALAEASQALGEPIGFELPQPARALASMADERPRLARAARAILARIASDTRETRALAHFSWAVQIADHRVAAAGAVARYLAGPAIPDLSTMTAADESALSLRWRALRRRLAGVST